MSKKSDELLQDNLAMRWSTTSNPAANSTAVCASKIANPLGRLNLDFLAVSLDNHLGAAAVNSVLSIRTSGVGGSVLAQIPLVAAASGAAAQVGTVNLPGKVGQAISFDLTLPGASVTQHITAAGWEDMQR